METENKTEKVENLAENDKPKGWKKYFKLTKADYISLGILLAFILIYILTPKAYSVTTARYNMGTDEDQKNVETALGLEDTENDFKLYFQYYNVVHELGHGLIRYNSHKKFGNAEEEQLVNDFAAAFWKTYGEPEKVERLHEIAAHAAYAIPNNANGTDYMTYADENWRKKEFQSFNGYGWFQFNSSMRAFEKTLSLDEALNAMGISGYTLPASPEKMIYSEINEEVSTGIINDVVRTINSWGLTFPEVHHHFNNDPNQNYSRPVKNFGLFDFPQIF